MKNCDKEGGKIVNGGNRHRGENAKRGVKRWRVNDSNLLKKIVEARKKLRYLKHQIFALKQFEDNTILAISRFLLMSQLVEFELKLLIPR